MPLRVCTGAGRLPRSPACGRVATRRSPSTRRASGGRAFRPVTLRELERKHSHLRRIGAGTGVPLADLQQLLDGTGGDARRALALDHVRPPVAGSRRIAARLAPQVAALPAP